MIFKIFQLCVFSVAFVKALDDNLQHLPYDWYSNTVLSDLGFDYGTSLKGIVNSKWIFSTAIANKSTGIDLMAASPSSNQAFIEWTGKTTKSEWRSEMELKLDFDATIAAGNCPMFGYILHPGSMTINSDNTIPNFKGLAVWLKFCENGGGILGHFTTSNLASYDPYIYALGSTCDSCSFGNTVPTKVELAFQLFSERLQVVMRVPGMISSMCINYISVSGFKNFATMNPLSVYLVGVNGNYGDLEVVSHEFNQLGENDFGCK